MKKLIFILSIFISFVVNAQNTAQDFFYQAEIKSSYFDADGAIINFKKAIKIDPSYTEAYYKIGLIYFDKSNFEEAIIYFDKAITSDNSHINSYYLRARSKFELKKFKEAIEDFDNAFTNKKDTKVYYGRGLAKFFAEDYKGAIEDFNLSIKYKFKTKKKLASSDAYFYRALSNQKLGKEKEACEDLKKAKEFGSTKSKEELKGTSIKCN